jgi:hypothetical protein
MIFYNPMTNWTRRHLMRLAALAPLRSAPAEPHPRALLTPALVREIAVKVKGPFAAEYRTMIETARLGPQGLENQWGIPGAFMEAGLAFLVERELGRDGRPYAERILDIWRRPEWQKPGLRRHFGWQGLLYDWIYDALTDAERDRFGELLGEWVATWWNNGEVNIPRSGWWYNQHWGPAHLDEANHRVALLAKLFIDLGVMGHAGRFEDAVRKNFTTFRERLSRAAGALRAPVRAALPRRRGPLAERPGSSRTLAARPQRGAGRSLAAGCLPAARCRARESEAGGLAPGLPLPRRRARLLDSPASL